MARKITKKKSSKKKTLTFGQRMASQRKAFAIGQVSFKRDIAALNLTPAQEAKAKKAFAGKLLEIKVKFITQKPVAKIEFQIDRLGKGRTKTILTLPKGKKRSVQRFIAKQAAKVEKGVRKLKKKIKKARKKRKK